MKKKILTLVTIEYTNSNNDTVITNRLVLSEVDDNTTKEALFVDVKEKASAWVAKNVLNAQHIIVTPNETIS